jgi:3-oxoacyl-[acyl-carrier-protein] synthase-3
MNQLVVTGLGSYLPTDSVDNAHLSPLEPPLSVEEMDAIGVLRRGHASDGESVEQMGILAAERALHAADTDAAELDFIIFISWTTRRYVPDVAPRIQDALGARRAMAFDLCCACSGFLQALSIAHGYLLQPRYTSGLILASDRSSSRMRPRSRATLIFGDGAAAAVVARDGDAGIRLIDYEIRTDGRHNGIMEIDAEGYLLPHIRQRDLNALAGRSMADVSRAVLDRAGMRLDDVDWVVPHSGTAGVQSMLRQYLEVPAERVLTALPIQGNLAAAAIPCALRHFLDEGPLAKGNRVLATAVGLGWQYSAAVLELL